MDMVFTPMISCFTMDMLMIFPWATVMTWVEQAEQRAELLSEHEQFAEFFRHNLDAADVRVEEIASVSSGASLGAKQTGGRSTTWRKHKEHHEYVVKRSLQRARRRALLGGTTLYRGRLYTSAELGLPGTPYQPSQLTVGSRRALQAHDKGRLDRILAVWPPECGPLTEEQARPLRAGQLGVLSVNLGGFSREGYDEFQQWAHSPNVVEHVHIIFVQETWRPSCEFSSDSWHWIQSGTKKAQHQGVAILLNKKLAAARCVRFAEVVKGRILKVHLPAEPGNHLRRRPITLICVYQRARVSEQAVVYEKREKIWEQVNRVLASVPRRHTLLVSGDWNTPLLEDGSFVGSGVLQSKWLPSDHAQFAGILQAHGLCALNTWGPVSSAATFVSPGASGSAQDEGVATQIDFILGRRGQVSTTGRAAMPVPHIHFSSWRMGTRHLPLAAIITDSRAEWKQSTKQPNCGPARDLMTNVLSQSPEVRQAFQDCVEQAVASLSVSTVMPNEVDAALMQVSMDMFSDLAPAHAPKPWQTSEVQITLKQVWAGRTELCKVQSNLLSGENMHGVLAVWTKRAQFHKLRKQLRKVSAEQRRQRWDTQLREAEQALDKGDAHAFYSAIKRMLPKLSVGEFSSGLRQEMSSPLRRRWRPCIYIGGRSLMCAACQNRTGS